MLDREMVQARLEEAGATLLALPGGGRNVRVGSSMPEPLRVMIEAYGWTGVKVRPPTPSAAAITRMDEALRWVSLIEAAPGRWNQAELHSPHGGVMLRQIVNARMLVDPVTLRHLYSWNRIGRMIGADHKAVQRWHNLALGLIVTQLMARNDTAA